jgi:protein-tyrosine phosphatase
LNALVGRPMDDTSRQLLLEHGIDGEAHRARQLTPSMLRDSDLVFVMERGHMHAVNQLVPEVSGKVFLLDKWLQGRDIPDPYRQQRPAFEHVYELIEPAVQSWLRYL